MHYDTSENLITKNIKTFYTTDSPKVKSITRRSILDFSAAKHRKWLRRLSIGPVSIWLTSPVYNDILHGLPFIWKSWKYQAHFSRGKV